MCDSKAIVRAKVSYSSGLLFTVDLCFIMVGIKYFFHLVCREFLTPENSISCWKGQGLSYIIIHYVMLHYIML